MKNKKHWYSSKWMWFFIILVVVVLIPILVNEIYKSDDGYYTLWEAKDVLMFYGSILGGCATLVAVLISIRHSHKSIREDKRLFVIPFLSINTLYEDKIKDELNAPINTISLIYVASGNLPSIKIYSDLSNVGLGSMINLRVKDICIENKSIESSTNSTCSLPVGQSGYLRLELNDVNLDLDTLTYTNNNFKLNITCVFEFCDVMGHVYNQYAEYYIKVTRDEKGLLENNANSSILNIQDLVFFQNKISEPKLQEEK